MLKDAWAQHRRAVLVIGCLALMATAGTAGAAIAASSGSPASEIKVCINRSNSTMRYVASVKVSCSRGERGVSWNEDGAKGDRGVDGADGANGLNGTNGANGINGANGSSGADGATILSGTAPPTSALGRDGDFYLRNPATAPVLYGPRASGQWPAGVSLVGPAGSGGGTGSASDGWEKVVDPTPPVFDVDADGDPVTITSTATCPSAKIAVGGGHTTSDLTGFISVVDDGPTALGAGWSVSGVSYPTTSSVTLTAYAVCVNR